MAMAKVCHQYNFTDCDGRISHILGKIESHSANEVVSELAIEAEYEVLFDVKEKIFGLCKDIYENKLREQNIIGENEHIDISAQRRHKKDDNENLAEDVVKLYQYAIGLQTDFPKDILARSSKFKDITQIVEKQPGEDEKDCSEGRGQKETLHQKLFNLEIMNLVKEQSRSIEKLPREKSTTTGTGSYFKCKAY